MDFNYETSIAEMLPGLQDILNTCIQENHRIIMKPDSKNQDLKWWTCEKWKMPCGGTHVKSTKEIGPVTLRRVNKGKGRERI